MIELVSQAADDPTSGIYIYRWNGGEEGLRGLGLASESLDFLGRKATAPRGGGNVGCLPRTRQHRCDRNATPHASRALRARDWIFPVLFFSRTKRLCPRWIYLQKQIKAQLM